MKAELTAIVVGGMLKPDEQLFFPDQTRVKLTIETIVQTPDVPSAWDAIKARLRQRPVHGRGKHFTRDELHERR